MIRDRLEAVKISILEMALSILEDWKEKLDEEDNHTVNEKVWNVFILNTKTHIAVIAAKEEISDVIPEDGSFINGMCIHSGLTESHAREKVIEYSNKLKLDEEVRYED